MKSRYWLYLIALLPVFIFRDYTPANELRYVSIVEEALNNNTWFTFYNHGEAYADKPPLYFWLMMISRIIFGAHHVWAIGLFSLLPAVGVMVVMDRWLKMEHKSHNPLTSGLMLGTCVMFIGSALVLRMDMLMTYFITLSLYTFYKLYKNKGRKRDVWLLPAWIFLAVFSKGPMGFLIPVVSIVSFLAVKEELTTLGRYLGWRQWVVLIGLCSLWFGAIYLEGGEEYLNNILFKQTVGRGVNSFHHKEPVWFYLPRLLFGFAPWSLLFLSVIGYSAYKRFFSTDIELFFLTVVAANFILLSLVSTKLDIYLLPIYPFVVYLSSMLLTRSEDFLPVSVSVWIPAVVFTVAFPASFFAGKFIPYELEGLSVFRAGIFFLTASGIAAMAYLTKKNIQGAVTTLALGLIATVTVASFGLPALNKYIGYRDMAEKARQTAQREGVNNYAYYMFDKASNMDVFLGQPLAHLDTVEDLDALVSSEIPTVLFIRHKDVRKDENLERWLTGHHVIPYTRDYSIYIIGK